MILPFCILPAIEKVRRWTNRSKRDLLLEALEDRWTPAVTGQLQSVALADVTAAQADQEAEFTVSVRYTSDAAPIDGDTIDDADIAVRSLSGVDISGATISVGQPDNSDPQSVVATYTVDLDGTQGAGAWQQFQGEFAIDLNGGTVQDNDGVSNGEQIAIDSFRVDTEAPGIVGVQTFVDLAGNVHFLVDYDEPATIAGAPESVFVVRDAQGEDIPFTFHAASETADVISVPDVASSPASNAFHLYLLNGSLLQDGVGNPTSVPDPAELATVESPRVGTEQVVAVVDGRLEDINATRGVENQFQQSVLYYSPAGFVEGGVDRPEAAILVTPDGTKVAAGGASPEILSPNLARVVYSFPFGDTDTWADQLQGVYTLRIDGGFVQDRAGAIMRPQELGQFAVDTVAPTLRAEAFYEPVVGQLSFHVHADGDPELDLNVLGNFSLGELPFSTEPLEGGGVRITLNDPLLPTTDTTVPLRYTPGDDGLADRLGNPVTNEADSTLATFSFLANQPAIYLDAPIDALTNDDPFSVTIHLESGDQTPIDVDSITESDLVARRVDDGTLVDAGITVAKPSDDAASITVAFNIAPSIAGMADGDYEIVLVQDAFTIGGETSFPIAEMVLGQFTLDRTAPVVEDMEVFYDANQGRVVADVTFSKDVVDVVGEQFILESTTTDGGQGGGDLGLPPMLATIEALGERDDPDLNGIPGSRRVRVMWIVEQTDEDQPFDVRFTPPEEGVTIRDNAGNVLLGEEEIRPVVVPAVSEADTTPPRVVAFEGTSPEQVPFTPDGQSPRLIEFRISFDEPINPDSIGVEDFAPTPPEAIVFSVDPLANTSGSYEFIILVDVDAVGSGDAVALVPSFSQDIVDFYGNSAVFPPEPAVVIVGADTDAPKLTRFDAALFDGTEFGVPGDLVLATISFNRDVVNFDADDLSVTIDGVAYSHPFLPVEVSPADGDSAVGDNAFLVVIFLESDLQGELSIAFDIDNNVASTLVPPAALDLDAGVSSSVSLTLEAPLPELPITAEIVDAPEVIDASMSDSTTFAFSVRYSAAAGLNATEIDGTELELIGPDGQSVGGTITNSSTDGGPTEIEMAYDFTLPSGESFSGLEQGLYQLRLKAGSVADLEGTLNDSALLHRIYLDVVPPSIEAYPIYDAANSTVTLHILTHAEQSLDLVTLQEEVGLFQILVNGNDVTASAAVNQTPTGLTLSGIAVPALSRLELRASSALASLEDLAGNPTSISESTTLAVFDSGSPELLEPLAFVLDDPTNANRLPDVITNSSAYELHLGVAEPPGALFDPGDFEIRDAQGNVVANAFDVMDSASVNGFTTKRVQLPTDTLSDGEYDVVLLEGSATSGDGLVLFPETDQVLRHFRVDRTAPQAVDVQTFYDAPNDEVIVDVYFNEEVDGLYADDLQVTRSDGSSDVAEVELAEAFAALDSDGSGKRGAKRWTYKFRADRADLDQDVTYTVVYDALFALSHVNDTAGTDLDGSSSPSSEITVAAIEADVAPPTIESFGPILPRQSVDSGLALINFSVPVSGVEVDDFSIGGTDAVRVFSVVPFNAKGDSPSSTASAGYLVRLAADSSYGGETFELIFNDVDGDIVDERDIALVVAEATTVVTLIPEDMPPEILLLTANLESNVENGTTEEYVSIGVAFSEPVTFDTSDLTIYFDGVVVPVGIDPSIEQAMSAGLIDNVYQVTVPLPSSVSRPNRVEVAFEAAGITDVDNQPLPESKTIALHLAGPTIVRESAISFARTSFDETTRELTFTIPAEGSGLTINSGAFEIRMPDGQLLPPESFSAVFAEGDAGQIGDAEIIVRTTVPIGIRGPVTLTLSNLLAITNPMGLTLSGVLPETEMGMHFVDTIIGEAPTLESIDTTFSATGATTGQISATFTFSEQVVGFDLNDFTVAFPADVNVSNVNLSPVAGSSSTFTYTADVTLPAESELVLPIFLAGDLEVTDGEGNVFVPTPEDVGFFAINNRTPVLEFFGPSTSEQTGPIVTAIMVFDQPVEGLEGRIEFFVPSDDRVSVVGVDAANPIAFRVGQAYLVTLDLANVPVAQRESFSLRFEPNDGAITSDPGIALPNGFTQETTIRVAPNAAARLTAVVATIGEREIEDEPQAIQSFAFVPVASTTAEETESVARFIVEFNTLVSFPSTNAMIEVVVDGTTVAIPAGDVEITTASGTPTASGVFASTWVVDVLLPEGFSDGDSVNLAFSGSFMTADGVTVAGLPDPTRLVSGNPTLAGPVSAELVDVEGYGDLEAVYVVEFDRPVLVGSGAFGVRFGDTGAILPATAELDPVIADGTRWRIRRSTAGQPDGPVTLVLTNPTLIADIGDNAQTLTGVSPNLELASLMLNVGSAPQLTQSSSTYDPATGELSFTALFNEEVEITDPAAFSLVVHNSSDVELQSSTPNAGDFTPSIGTASNEVTITWTVPGNLRDATNYVALQLDDVTAVVATDSQTPIGEPGDPAIVLGQRTLIAAPTFDTATSSFDPATQTVSFDVTFDTDVTILDANVFTIRVRSAGGAAEDLTNVNLTPGVGNGSQTWTVSGTVSNTPNGQSLFGQTANLLIADASGITAAAVPLDPTNLVNPVASQTLAQAPTITNTSSTYDPVTGEITYTVVFDTAVVITDAAALAIEVVGADGTTVVNDDPLNDADYGTPIGNLSTTWTITKTLTPADLAAAQAAATAGSPFQGRLNLEQADQVIADVANGAGIPISATTGNPIATKSLDGAPTIDLVESDFSASPEPATVSFTVTFNEPVELPAAAVVIRGPDGNPLDGLSVTNTNQPQTQRATVWTISATVPAGEEGDVDLVLVDPSLVVNASSLALDHAMGDLGTQSVDTVAPVIEEINPVQVSGEEARFTIIFSEAVSGFGEDDFTVEFDGTPVDATSISVLEAAGSTNQTWTVVVDLVQGAAGTLNLSIVETSAEATIVDQVSNPYSYGGTFPVGESIAINDETPPELVASQGVFVHDPATGTGTVTYTLNFSKVVTGLTPDMFQVELPDGSIVANATVLPVGDVGGAEPASGTWELTVPIPTGQEGPVVAELLQSEADGIVDLNGIAFVAPTSDITLQTVNVDTANNNPVSANVALADPQVTNQSSVTFWVTFAQQMEFGQYPPTVGDFALTLMVDGQSVPVAGAAIQQVAVDPNNPLLVSVVVDVDGVPEGRLGLIPSPTTELRDVQGNRWTTIGQSLDYVIDHVAPAVTSITRAPHPVTGVPVPSETARTQLEFIVSFDQAVFGHEVDPNTGDLAEVPLAPTDFGLTGSAAAHANSRIESVSRIAGTDQYRVLVHAGGDGTLGLEVVGDIFDAAGNAFEGSVGSVAIYEIDTVAPAVLIAPEPSIAATNADELTFHVTFTQPVVNVDANDFALNLVGDISAASIEVFADPVGTAGVNWIVTVSGIAAADGTGAADGILEVVPSIANDIVNELDVALDINSPPSQTTTIVVDQVAPLYSVTRMDPSGELTDESRLTFAVRFTKPLSSTLTLSDFDVREDLLGVFADGIVEEVVGVPDVPGGEVLTYHVTVQALDQGVVELLVSDELADRFGNELGGLTANQVFIVNRTAPVVSIEPLGPELISPALTPTPGTVIFQLNFDQEIGDIIPEDFASNFLLDANGVGGTIGQATRISATQWILAVDNVTGNGRLGLAINLMAATPIVDLAGNRLAFQPAASGEFTVDSAAPELESLFSIYPFDNPSNSSLAVFTAVFDEPVEGVDRSSFELVLESLLGSSQPLSGQLLSVVQLPADADFELDDLGLDLPFDQDDLDFDLAALSVDGHAYLIVVGGIAGNGELSVRIDPNAVIHDEAGNPLDAAQAQPSTPIVVDNQLVDLVGVPFVNGQQMGDLPTNAGTVVVQLSTERQPLENVDLDDFVILSNGVTYDEAVLSGAGQNYSLTITGLEGKGSVTIVLAGDADIATPSGNGVILTNELGFSQVGFEVDTIAPTVTILPDGPALTNANIITFTVAFQELGLPADVEVLTAEALQVLTTGSLRGSVLSVTPIGAGLFNVQVSAGDNQVGEMRLQILPNAVRDAVGNVAVPGSPSNPVEVDTTGLVASFAVGIQTPSLTNAATIAFEVTFNDSVGQVLNVDANDFLLFGDGAEGADIAEVTVSGPNSYTIVVMIPEGAIGAVQITMNGDNNIQDVAGNELQPTTPSPAVRVDRRPLVIQNVIPTGILTENSAYADIAFEVRFDRQVVDVTAASFTITGGGSEILGVSTPDGGRTFEVDIRVFQSGEFGIEVSSDVVDAFGNRATSAPLNSELVEIALPTPPPTPVSPPPVVPPVVPPVSPPVNPPTVVTQEGVGLLQRGVGKLTTAFQSPPDDFSTSPVALIEFRPIDAGITEVAEFDEIVFADFTGDGKTNAAGTFINADGIMVWIVNTSDVTAFNATQNRAAALFGIAGDKPMAEDIDGNGIAQFIVYRGAYASFSFDLNENAAWDGMETDTSVTYGLTIDQARDLGQARPDTPVVGRFMPGVAYAQIGVMRLVGDMNRFIVNASDVRDFSWDAYYRRDEAIWDFFNEGGGTALPVVGDFNGDGVDEAGVHHEVTNQFVLNRDATSINRLRLSVDAPSGEVLAAVAGHWVDESVAEAAVLPSNVGLLDSLFAEDEDLL
ncbi:hypothetical protein Pan216_13150 [Planctomycetes bacterium Pan216]|uniref:Uncharacterized protein n=1 Tax=Kolteria novifilia TaxID=2527975 RepID=A0A518B0J0_9BACT|nr:hypothetical protein Pan216_13150 [Planctomycetes bacterium Pan216]